ncbi:uncharacterized protein [Phyllobates terribilis]|uniref:uncharacterized protein n=1 Tax=Phyllobates terribilis TaxID=111132 RepID=UPI003CCAB74C
MKLSWILLLAVWLGFAPMYRGNKPGCYPTGNCYTIIITELTFTDANLNCGPKGSLTTMKSEQEKREILQFATQFQNRRNFSEFWIGLYQPEKTCIVKDKNLYGFIWISGEEETQVSEWDKIPKKTCTTKKRCVILQSRLSTTNTGFGNITWFWKNDKCTRRLPSICRFPTEFTPIEDLPSTAPTTQPMELTSFPTQTTEMIPPSINVLCREFIDNETVTCEVENIPYSCNDTYCFCGQMDDKGGGYGLRSCQENTSENCLGQCVTSSNISCVCGDHQTSCDKAECTINTSIMAMSTSAVVQVATSLPFYDYDNLFENLVIPLILGLVALGILIMLVWGGVQMCVRKKKPKRKKSIIPVAEPEASDTDSTDNSSDEEGDSQDMAEMA